MQKMFDEAVEVTPKMWQELIDAGWDEAHIEQQLAAGLTLDELVQDEHNTRREEDEDDA